MQEDVNTMSQVGSLVMNVLNIPLFDIFVLCGIFTQWLTVVGCVGTTTQK